MKLIFLLYIFSSFVIFVIKRRNKRWILAYVNIFEKYLFSQPRFDELQRVIPLKCREESLTTNCANQHKNPKINWTSKMVIV